MRASDVGYIDAKSGVGLKYRIEIGLGEGRY